MTDLNKDDMSMEKSNVGERPETTGGGMYKLAHWNYLLRTFYFFEQSTSGGCADSGT